MKKIIAIFMLIPALLFGATRNLVPNVDREGYVGKSSNQWGYGYFSNLFVNNIPITGSGAGLTNLQNTVSYMNTNTAAYDFSTSGGSCGTIAQNPAWTNILNVTNKGIAIGCTRIKFVGHLYTTSGNQTNLFGLSWLTNASGQAAIGAFVKEGPLGQGHQSYFYGEVPVNPSTGEFYYYCSTNTTVNWSINGAEFIK